MSGRAAADAAHSESVAAQRTGNLEEAERLARLAVELERGCERPARLGNHLMFLSRVLRERSDRFAGRGDNRRAIELALEMLSSAKEGSELYAVSHGREHSEALYMASEVRELGGVVEARINTAIDALLYGWLAPASLAVSAHLDPDSNRVALFLTAYKNSREFVIRFAAEIGSAAELEVAARELVAELECGVCEACGRGLGWLIDGDLARPQLACSACGAMFDSVCWRQ